MSFPGSGFNPLYHPQPDGPSSGPFNQPDHSPTSVTFTHRRSLPMKEAVSTLFVEMLRDYISAHPEPGVVPDFCMRHEFLLHFLSERSGFKHLIKDPWVADSPPQVILGPAVAVSSGAQTDKPLLDSVKDALAAVRLLPSSTPQRLEQPERDDVEARVLKVLNGWIARARSAWGIKSTDSGVSTKGTGSWIDQASLSQCVADIEKQLSASHSVALKLLGRGRHFEVIEALSQESSMASVDYLVDYAVLELLRDVDAAWTHSAHLRIWNAEDEQVRENGDKVYAAIASSWEARPCACRELAVLPAAEFFERFPSFTEFNQSELASVRVLILPGTEDAVTPRLYALRPPQHFDTLSERLVRDLEWVAFKYGRAAQRIQARARDEA